MERKAGAVVRNLLPVRTLPVGVVPYRAGIRPFGIPGYALRFTRNAPLSIVVHCSRFFDAGS